MAVLLFLPTLIFGGAIYIKPQNYITDPGTGLNFVDSFSRHNDRWTVETGLVCTGADKHKNQFKCVYKSDRNIEYLQAPPSIEGKPGETELGISARNDCTGPQCCSKGYGQACSSLTMGHIISAEKYTYGTYRFNLKAMNACDNYKPESWCYKEKWKFKNCETWARKGECESNPHYMSSCCKQACGTCVVGSRSQHSVWDWLGCISLQSSSDLTDASQMMAITLCIPALAPIYAMFIWQYKGRVHSQRIRMPFNAAMKKHYYQLHWSPNKFEWWIDGSRALHVQAPQFSIPDEPMYIKMFLLSHARVGAGDETETVNLRMRIYGVRYRQFANATMPDLQNQRPPLVKPPVIKSSLSPLDNAAPSWPSSPDNEIPMEPTLDDDDEDVPQYDHTELM